jgi:type I restriction enzyme M protein
VLKRCKKPDDVLFINANEYFEKGKRQNRLLPEHIDKVVSTYQFRKEEDRYSMRVSMERIEKEGYNLNISRYISTAKQEEEINLGAVNAELVKLGRVNTNAGKIRLWKSANPSIYRLLIASRLNEVM